MKTCPNCKKTKSNDQFFIRKNGYGYKCKECEKLYYIEKKEQYAEKRAQKKQEKTDYDKQYRQDNKEKISKDKAEYEKRKMITDPNYRIARLLRMRLRQALKNNQKKGSAVDDLGCSVDELRQRIESMFYPDKITGEQMTWQNHGYGSGKWQIDHIKALYLFDLSNREQFLTACHFSNLQPLWHDDHTKKTTVDISPKS